MAAAEKVLVVGATSRLGGFLRAAWGAGQTGFRPLWQTRRTGAVPDGWCLWDPLSGREMPGAAAVLVLAGVTRGSAAELSANVTIAEAVVRAAAGAGARHVFLASSAAVYGPTGPVPVPETAPLRPARPYGAAKLAMERAALPLAGRDGPGITALRIGNVAGADLLARSVRGGDPLRLDRFAGSGGGPVRSYVGPLTLARVVADLLLLALAGAPLPRVLNLAAPAPVAMADLLEAAGIPFVWQAAPTDAVEHALMDVSRLAALVPLLPDDSLARSMVAQWRRIERSDTA